jgi:ribosome modulation factor
VAEQAAEGSKLEQIKSEGYLAASVGVPCECNPYAPGRNAAAWLVGWCQFKNLQRMETSREG